MKYSSKTKKKNCINVFERNKNFQNKINKLKEEIKAIQNKIDSDSYGLFDESAHKLLKGKKAELKQVIEEYKLFAKKCIIVVGAVVIAGLAALGIGLSNSNEEPTQPTASPTSDVQPGPEETTFAQEMQTNPEVKYTKSLAETELDFINLYKKSNLTAQEKNKLEDLAFEIVERTSDLKSIIFSELNNSEIGKNFFESYGEEISSVEAFIHNYSAGGDVGVSTYNGKDTGYNYDHNGTVLAASILSEKQPDNVSLAANRITASCISNMTQSEIEQIVIKGSDGNRYYDLSSDTNTALRAQEIGFLKGAIKQAKIEYTMVD